MCAARANTTYKTSAWTSRVTPSSRLPGCPAPARSSLAFDTIFAEGQRRYVESLSAYARQFLGQMDKPDVDFIEGLSPAVSIDQKSTSKNPRSTVGTITEIYDYLRLLFARIGSPHCPVCGEPVARQTPQQIVDQVLAMDAGTRFQVLAPVVRDRKGEYETLFRRPTDQGIRPRSRRWNGLPADRGSKAEKQEKHSIEVVVDRLVVKDSAKQRLTDSVESALGLAGGIVLLDFVDLDDDDPARERRFSNTWRAPTTTRWRWTTVEPRSFSFNTPYGACPECSGLGVRKEVDAELVIRDGEKTLRTGCVGAVVERRYGRLLSSPVGCVGRGSRFHRRHGVGGPAVARAKGCFVWP